jgi:SH3 domain protein
VLSRYLMREPSAREQLARLTGQLTDATEAGSTMSEQLDAVRGQYNNANNRIAVLEREKQSLERELAEIKSTAANVLAIDKQNKDLRDDLASAQIEVSTLEQQNRELTAQSTRYWFMSGGLVLVVGIILGLWLPRIRWQKRSRYDRF